MASNLRQVAALAGVSSATVSRVYAHPDAVSDRTRQRVLDAAQELGWAPNQTARSLALGRTGNIGLMIPDMSNPALGSAIKEVQHFARDRGFSLFVASGDGSTDEERASVHAVAAKVDGLVLVAPRMSPEQLTELQQVSPLALVNRVSLGIPTTVIPSGDGMKALVEHLAGKGHRRIAYLAGPGFSLSNANRVELLLETAGAHGIETVLLGPIEADFLYAGRQAADEVLQSKATAVIGYNDLVAVGLTGELQRRGIRAGIDLAVAGFDGSWLGESTSPQLTSVAIPFSAAIQSGLMDVIDLIEGRQPVAYKELPSQLLIRGSTERAQSDMESREPQPTS